MTVTIHLTQDAEQTLKNRAEAAGLSAEGYAQRVLERDLGTGGGESSPGRPLRSVTEEILRRVRKLPPEAFQGPPRDGASQHDHYIYGTPKRDDL